MILSLFPGIGNLIPEFERCLADQINDLLAEALEPPPFYVP